MATNGSDRDGARGLWATALRQRVRVRPLAGYAGLTSKTLPREIGAGVSLTALGIPLNIGFAQIAGLPPTAGLYALLLPAIAFALLATSRQLIAAPDAASAALVASSLGGLAAAGSAGYAAMAAAQALIGGLVFAVFWLFGLGVITSFLSQAVLVGFVGGLAAEILLSQAERMTGLKIEAQGFFTQLWQFITGLGSSNVWSLLLAAGTAVVMLAGRRLAPALPWPLIAIAAATVAVIAGHLTRHGVAVLGQVQSGLPRLHWPVVPGGNWFALLPSAVALTLITLAEGLLAARRYAERHGYRIDADQELLAFGAANALSGVTGGFAVGSSSSRSAAMDQAGSRTQVPAVVTAGLTALLLVFGTGLLKDLPEPALGAVVAIVVLPLLGIAKLRRLWRLRRSEFFVAVACMTAVLILGPVRGVMIAFLLTAVGFIRRAANPPHSVIRPSDPAASPVWRFSAPLFFANAEFFHTHVEDLITAADPKPTTFVLDCQAITDIDVTGADTLHAVADWCTRHDVTLAVSGASSSLQALLGHYGLLDKIAVRSTSRAS